VFPFVQGADEPHGRAVGGRSPVARQPHGDPHELLLGRQLDRASQRRGQLGRAVRAVERADALEAPRRLGRQGEADDVQVDLEALPGEPLRHGAHVSPARLLAVRDEHDHLAAAGPPQVLGRPLQREGDGRGARRLGALHRREQEAAVHPGDRDGQEAVLASVLVEGHGPRAVDPQSDVEVGGLRQAADERGERLLGRGDPQAAVGQLVEHRARGVEDEDDVRRPRDGRLRRGRQGAEPGEDESEDQT